MASSVNALLTPETVLALRVKIVTLKFIDGIHCDDFIQIFNSHFPKEPLSLERLGISSLIDFLKHFTTDIIKIEPHNVKPGQSYRIFPIHVTLPDTKKNEAKTISSRYVHYGY